jgi:hypothetical protein
VSQCVWNDGATPQIDAILSPSYATNLTTGYSSSSASTSKSKPISGGIIAGAAIASTAVLAISGVAAWYFLRRQNRSALPPVTDNIGLTNVELDAPNYQADALSSSHSSPFLADKKLYTEDMPPRSLPQCQDSRELGMGEEIHQLPTHDNREGDYMSVSSHIEAERRAANTPQIDGRRIVYELHGSKPTPSEMDDEWSRQGRSPHSPQIPTWAWTNLSPRSTSPYIASPRF